MNLDKHFEFNPGQTLAQVADELFGQVDRLTTVLKVHDSWIELRAEPAGESVD